MNLTHYPVLIFALSFLALWLAAWSGWSVLRTKRALTKDLREDFRFILARMLTLLALLIGFGFSMAVGRYDLRKTYEEAEANAIGTEDVRADLLPATDALKIRALASIAVGCSLLIGYGVRSAEAGPKLLPILPLGASIAFMLIADLDAPRHGIIRVKPQNLISLAESLGQTSAK